MRKCTEAAVKIKRFGVEGGDSSTTRESPSDKRIVKIKDEQAIC